MAGSFVRRPWPISATSPIGMKSPPSSRPGSCTSNTIGSPRFSYAALMIAVSAARCGEFIRPITRPRLVVML